MITGKIAGATTIMLVCAFGVLGYALLSKDREPKFSEVYELGCKDGRDGIGPIFSGIHHANLRGDTYELLFIEGGIGYYKMRGGEFCALTTVGDMP